MIFHQRFFRKGPESFNPVDVDFSLFERALVVDSEMPVSAEHERIIPTPFVSTGDWTVPGILDGFIQQRFSYPICENADGNFPPALQDSEYNCLVTAPRPCFPRHATRLPSPPSFRTIRRETNFPEIVAIIFFPFLFCWTKKFHHFLYMIDHPGLTADPTCALRSAITWYSRKHLKQWRGKQRKISYQRKFFIITQWNYRGSFYKPACTVDLRCRWAWRI